MRRDSRYEDMDMPDVRFPIKLFLVESTTPGSLLFDAHWHEQIELHYYLSGTAQVRCGGREVTVTQGDVLLVNSNELHHGESVTGDTRYWVFIFDLSLMQSSFQDNIETKFVAPISQSLILFDNYLGGDGEVEGCIRRIIDEYEVRHTGYELAIKSEILRLIVLLLRGHVRRVLTESEYQQRTQTAARYQKALDSIERNLTGTISLQELARQVSVSPSHFCRQFRLLTGRTLSEYVNHQRINRAAALLAQGDVNVSEAAERVGIHDLNYFSRLFKRERGLSPTAYRAVAAAPPGTIARRGSGPLGE